MGGVSGLHYSPNSTAKVISLVGDVYRYIVTGAETSGAYFLFEAFVPPNGGPPPHVHHREDESFLVLDGQVAFQCDGHELVLRAGDFVLLPRDIPHCFRNTGDGAARMLIQTSPAGFEHFFDAVGTPISGPDDPPLPVTQEQIVRVIAIAPQFGLEILVPKQP